MQYIKLKDAFTIQKGKKVEQVSEYQENCIRCIQIEDLRDNNNLKYCLPNKKNTLVDEDDILIAWDGANAGTVGIGLVGALGSTLARMTLKTDKLLASFVAILLQSKFDYFQQTATGATIPHISRRALEDIDLPIPDISIQKKIVKALEQAEGLIKKRQAQIAALDELAQSVFLEMFGDPFYNQKGWEKGKIADLTETTQYGTSSKANEKSGDFPILRMNNITYNGGWDLSSLKYIDLNDKEQKKYLVHKGELLFNRTNSKELVGKTAVYRNDIPFAYAGYLIKLIPNGNANAEFISAFLNSQYGKRILFNKAKSIVGMANINAQELVDIDIYLPPKKLQDEYAYRIGFILKNQKQLEDSLENYKKLYNVLLQKAFKGELFQ